MSKNAPMLAIVGMACRFPKGLESIAALWDALCSRFNTADVVPKDRWTADRYFSSNAISKGKSYIRRGNFLKQDVSTFDANFFGISPRDAENMDPQQRLLLEVVWEAFENAGLNMLDHAGRQVGVYVGGFMLDHMITQMTPANRSQINQNTAAGMMMTMLSNRISHTFDLRGPSLSIDTACSSSLVAFHYACQDLWRGACELAVIGGSNVMLRPEYPMGMCKGHFLSRDGECKSFDSRADGYGRGEGAAIVLVKTYEAAIRDNDQILATVLGTGSNQDGHTPGISMPNGVAQRALVEQVCTEYQIDPSQVRYAECHGTGTAIGDPTEAKALGDYYGRARQAKNLSPLVIGSIKSNIGHLEAAAGIAAVVKSVLTIMHRTATPLANLQTPNPDIPFQELGIRLADDLIPLADQDESFCVAINSFGYGGSNAHAVLGTVPASTENTSVSNAACSSNCCATRSFPHFLPLSARSPLAVQKLAANYAESLRTGTSLDDLLYTASFKRAALSQRAVVMGSSKEELLAALDALSTATESEQVVRGSETFQGKRKPVFVFTGMGPQWWGMGQELYQSEPIYRQAVEEADAVFQQISGFSALKEMLKSEADARMSDTRIAQPANFLIQIGIYAVLKAAGVEPGAVIGHSVGELGSAYAAGTLTLRDAMLVCFHRSQMQATCAGTGGMMAVGLSKEDSLKLIASCSDRVSIAAVNGPTNVTLAGDLDALVDLAITLNSNGTFHRKLEVEVPYHSPMMDPIMQPLSDALATVQPRLPALPLYSTVTGQRVEGISFGADYWPLNVRQSVEFAPAIETLLADGFNTFLEIGPHPVLANSIKDCAKVAGKESRSLYTLRRNQPERRNLHRAIMGLFAEGCQLDWRCHHPHGKLVSIGNYPWQREKYWLENERGIQDRIATIEYPILGIQEAPGTPVWRNDFDHEPVNYLRDHVVTGMPVLPGAAYIESLLELSSIQFPDAKCLLVRNLSIQAPMVILAERGLDSVTSYEPATQLATIRSLENGRLGGGQVHITANIAGLTTCSTRYENLQALRQSFTNQQDVTSFYRGLDQMGLSYGPAFQTVRELRLNEAKDQVLACIEIEPSLTHDEGLYRMHPTMLDACFQTLSAMLGNAESTYLPTGIGELCLYVDRLPRRIWSLGEKVEQNSRYIDCHITLFDEEGRIVATVRSMRSTAAAKRERTDQFGDKVKRQILAYEWQYGENLTEPKRLGGWLVIGDHEGTANPVAERLEYYGAMVGARVSFGSSYEAEGNSYTMRRDRSEDAMRLLAECGEVDGIVFAHGLDPHGDQDPTGEAAIVAMVTMTQAILAQNWERKPRVYVLTQSAFAAREHDDRVDPRQSALNGFTRVAYNELDGLQFSSVDLPANVDEEVIDAVALELLCDDRHDEVALRSGLRMVSQLVDSTMLSSDRIDYLPLDDEHPILIRPLRPDCESVGTARVLATRLPQLSDKGVRIRFEATVVPANLLLDPNADTLDQPFIEYVGQVLEVGAQVNDLRTGMRVCGFAPSDLGSHLVADRSHLLAVELDEQTSANHVISSLGLATRAEHALSQIDGSDCRSALVEYSPLAVSIAHGLLRRGIRVALIAENPSELDSNLHARFAVYDACPMGIAAAKNEQSPEGGFDLLVASMHHWMKRFDLEVLSQGSCIIDLDEKATSIALPPHVQSVVRADLHNLMRKSKRAEEAIAHTLHLIEKGEIHAMPSLEVRVSDIAWQKLPLADTNTMLIIRYDTQGKDLPVVLADEMHFEANASYLITGGFGGFGEKTAEWLIQHGAKHLILTGRTGADTPQRKAIVKRLEQLGATVLAAACDTSDFARLKDLFLEIEAKLPPLRGVFHSGALILDQPIPEIDKETLEQVMRSKALGAWNLHVLTSKMHLDHFVLYSSVANLVGNSRQSIYSAANGFLNGLAQKRQSMGLPGTSVNWGAIADVGVVAQDEKLEQFLRYTGLRGISAMEGLEVLRQALARHVPQFGVSMITSWADWARFETRGAKSPRFAVLIANDSAAKDNSVRDALIAELMQMDPADQVEVLAMLMREIIASVLKSDPESIPIDRSIDQLGVDSLMATEIQSLFDSKLGVSISILELLGNATVRSVASQSLKTLMQSSNDSLMVTNAS